MDKRYRINLESGMIHDLALPCWWATHTHAKCTADFTTQEEACAALRSAGLEPVVCGRCTQRKTSKKYLAEHPGQNNTNGGPLT